MVQVPRTTCAEPSSSGRIAGAVLYAFFCASALFGCNSDSNDPTKGHDAAVSGSGGAQATTGGSGGQLPASSPGSGGAGGAPIAPGSGGAGAGAGKDSGTPALHMDSGIDAGIDAGPLANADAGSSGEDRCHIANYDPAHAPAALALTGNLGTHDPSAIAAHGQYYLFYTGGNVQAKTSTDLLTWKAAPAAFPQLPAWVAKQVPSATELWAPDISLFGGMYHLYYAASKFGSNQSCIGHATRAALDAGSWSDHGTVVCSNANGENDDWNAIDPNAVVEQDGTPWLAFGSFWSGLKIVRLDQTGARADTELHAIAARPNDGGALEAPYIVRRCGYYYLFASFDRCCQGVDSTYKIMVGRSASVTGPYADKDGKPMLQGGGTLLVGTSGRWHGPGHNAVLFTDSAAYNIYHSYDANQNGASILRISDLAWDADGWPVSGGP
jgi:arabinan endo-1,5-alpha-L-arabinosidase